MLSEDRDKTRNNSSVTFVTHQPFAVLLFLLSCCVNSLINSEDYACCFPCSKLSNWKKETRI